MSHGPEGTEADVKKSPEKLTEANNFLNITPLAPSVEKAYYRKCIELKRRLNEVETANDELKIRRARLDRGILKMRVERAFLLDEMRKRMEYNVDGSEASGDEGAATPPPDRPLRDRRRRPEPAQGGDNAGSAHTAALSGRRQSQDGQSKPNGTKGDGANSSAGPAKETSPAPLEGGVANGDGAAASPTAAGSGTIAPT